MRLKLQTIVEYGTGDEVRDAKRRMDALQERGTRGAKRKVGTDNQRGGRSKKLKVSKTR
jgi:hypothetical protein